MAQYDDSQRWSGRTAAGDRPGRPPLDGLRLWSGGLAAAVVAALTGLVGVLVTRAVFRSALFAPRTERVFEYPYTGTARLCVVAAAAALAATGLAHLLLLSAPRPLTFFGWIVGLVVGILVSSAAAGATDRPRTLP